MWPQYRPPACFCLGCDLTMGLTLIFFFCGWKNFLKKTILLWHVKMIKWYYSTNSIRYYGNTGMLICLGIICSHTTAAKSCSCKRDCMCHSQFFVLSLPFPTSTGTCIPWFMVTSLQSLLLSSHCFSWHWSPAFLL